MAAEQTNPVEIDEAVPPETLARIREIISANADGAIGGA